MGVISGWGGVVQLISLLSRKHKEEEEEAQKGRASFPMDTPTETLFDYVVVVAVQNGMFFSFSFLRSQGGLLLSLTLFSFWGGGGGGGGGGGVSVCLVVSASRRPLHQVVLPARARQGLPSGEDPAILFPRS